MKQFLLRFFVVVLCSYLPTANSEPSVLILAENLQQVVTSSTLQWVAANSKTPRNYENAVVGAFQIMQDENNEENDAIDSVSGLPVYVCRAKQNGIWVSGQLRPHHPRCIVSLHGIVHHFDRYEILLNIEGGARLSWVYRDKYTIIPQGSVAGGEEPLRNFISRRNANSHNKAGSLTHFLGKLDPSDNFGKFTLVDQNDDEIEYEDGEILVETEPIEYELNGVKTDTWKRRVTRNPLILGEVVLKNEGNRGVVRVDTVISYDYEYTLYWGHGHGLLTGLPLTVHLQNGSAIKGEWGISEAMKRVEVAPIEAYLAPGTAVNVTLRGNYGESDTPYTATVVALYKDGEKKDRLIKDSRRERSMWDVLPEFGPVYFLHNNSFVPTTTTTTTTSTTTRSTTTKATTTTTEEVVPITIPEVIQIPQNKVKKIFDENAAMDKKRENNSMMSDEGDALSLQKKNSLEQQGQPGGSSMVTSSLLIIFTAIACVRRLT